MVCVRACGSVRYHQRECEARPTLHNEIEWALVDTVREALHGVYRPQIRVLTPPPLWPERACISLMPTPTPDSQVAESFWSQNSGSGILAKHARARADGRVVGLLPPCSSRVLPMRMLIVVCT